MEFISSVNGGNITVELSSGWKNGDGSPVTENGYCVIYNQHVEKGASKEEAIIKLKEWFKKRNVII